MIFFRLLKPGLKSISPTARFSDISGDEWYDLAIDLLAHYEVMGGYPDGSSRLDQPITRSELAVVVSRFEHLADTDENPIQRP